MYMVYGAGEAFSTEKRLGGFLPGSQALLHALPIPSRRVRCRP